MKKWLIFCVLLFSANGIFAQRGYRGREPEFDGGGGSSNLSIIIAVIVIIIVVVFKIVIWVSENSEDKGSEQTGAKPIKETGSSNETTNDKKENHKNKMPVSSIVTIGQLDVMTKDLGQMSWEDGKKACTNLGHGWRLPLKKELNVLYENKNKVGGFNGSAYWSLTELRYYDSAWIQFFSDGIQNYNSKSGVFFVRAIKTQETDLEPIEEDEDNLPF